MGKVRRALSTGVSKTYYSVDGEFEAVGTYFVDSDMYYTAAHRTYGLWLSGMNQKNEPIPVGFVTWDNISRIIIDDKHGTVFVVVKSYDRVLEKADNAFKVLYKKAFSHTFPNKAGGGPDTAIKLPKSLFSGNILPYLGQRYPIEYQEVKGAVSVLSVIAPVLILILMILSFIL